MATTTYFLNTIMSGVFKSETLPTNYYIGLSTSTPTTSGTNVTEPSGGSYARVDVTSYLGTPSSGVITNTSNISFPDSTASWGTVTHYVIYDALTGGNLLMFNALSSPMTIGTDVGIVIKSGRLQLTLSDAANS